MSEFVEVLKSGARLVRGVLTTLVGAKVPESAQTSGHAPLFTLEDSNKIGRGTALKFVNLGGRQAMSVHRMEAPQSLLDFIEARSKLLGDDAELLDLAVQVLFEPVMDVALRVLDSNGNDFVAAVARMRELHAFLGLASALFGERAVIAASADDVSLAGTMLVESGGRLVRFTKLSVANDEAVNLLTARVPDGLMNFELGAARLRQVARSVPGVYAELQVYGGYRKAFAEADSAFLLGRDAALTLLRLERAQDALTSEELHGTWALMDLASLGAKASMSLERLLSLPPETSSSIANEAKNLLSGRALPLFSDQNPIWRASALGLLAYWRDSIGERIRDADVDHSISKT
jgi:hypothetical protein